MVGKTGKQNLPALLQRNGVDVKYMVSHGCALPDTRNLHHKGLRAYLLTQYTAFIPRFFGLDYHIYNHETKLWERLNSLKSASMKAFSPPDGGKINLFEAVIDELDAHRTDDRNIFLLVHLFVYEGSGRRHQTPFEIDKAVKKGSQESLQELRDIIDVKAHANDYCYDAEEQWWADERKSEYYQDIEHLDEIFGKFLQDLDQLKLKKDFDIIVTADHGKTYDDGKIWYGYHIDQNVTRIPLIYYRGDDIGKVDARLCQTADIPGAIVETFGLPNSFQSEVITGDASIDEVICFGLKRGKNSIKSAAIFEESKKHVFEIDHKLKEIRYSISSFVDEFGREANHYHADPDSVEAFLKKLLSKVKF